MVHTTCTLEIKYIFNKRQQLLHTTTRIISTVQSDADNRSYDLLFSGYQNIIDRVGDVIVDGCKGDTFLPNILSVIRLLFSHPKLRTDNIFLTTQINTASRERTFFCLKRLKSCLRTTKGQHSLSSFAVLRTRRSDPIDSDKIINEIKSNVKRKNKYCY